MAVQSFVVVLATFFCILTQGDGLKCNTYSCTGASWDALECKMQTETICPSGDYSCLYSRMSVRQKDGSLQNTDMGSCQTTAQCNVQASETCEKLKNVTAVQECKVQCCQKDLCNERNVPTTYTGTTSPSGGGVTCYFCDSLTINGVLKKTNCNKPQKRKCNDNQDRCITVKMTLVNQVGKLEPLLRTCSNEKYCNNVCRDTNVTDKGQVTSCDTKCCFGDLCNMDPTGRGNLAVFDTSVVLFGFIALIFLFVLN